MAKHKTPVFFDKDGNRFIFAGYAVNCETGETAAGLSGANVVIEAMMLSVTTGLQKEEEWLEFDNDHFPHVKTDLLSRAFEHGGVEVMCFSGPQFDLAMAAHKEEHGDPV